MSILFMFYVSRVLDRLLRSARQLASHAAYLLLKHGQSDACQPDPEKAEDNE
jgi:hypothetical protein